MSIMLVLLKTFTAAGLKLKLTTAGQEESFFKTMRIMDLCRMKSIGVFCVYGQTEEFPKIRIFEHRSSNFEMVNIRNYGNSKQTVKYNVSNEIRACQTYVCSIISRLSVAKHRNRRSYNYSAIIMTQKPKLNVFSVLKRIYSDEYQW